MIPAVRAMRMRGLDDLRAFLDRSAMARRRALRLVMEIVFEVRRAASASRSAMSSSVRRLAVSSRDIAPEATPLALAIRVSLSFALIVTDNNWFARIVVVYSRCRTRSSALSRSIMAISLSWRSDVASLMRRVTAGST